MDPFKELMADTAAVLGLDGLEPDENGICEFISEEARIAVMWCPDAGDSVLVTAKVAEAVSGDSLLTALKANHRFAETKGATVSIDPDDGAFTLSVHRPVASLDGEKMTRLLEDFMSAILSLRMIVDS